MFDRTGFTLISLFIGLMVIVGGIYTISAYKNENVYHITVTDKETKKDGDSTRYLIFAELENGETKVFENTDALFVGKFNSSDLYGQMKIDEQYEVTTIGYRFPIFSTYENIIKVSKR